MLKTLKKTSLRQPLRKPNKIPELNPIIGNNKGNLLQIQLHLQNKPKIT